MQNIWSDHHKTDISWKYLCDMTETKGKELPSGNYADEKDAGKPVLKWVFHMSGFMSMQFHNNDFHLFLAWHMVQYYIVQVQ